MPLSETTACPPSPIAGDFSSAISHILSLLQSVTLLVGSIDASPYTPAIVLYYYTLEYSTLRFKMFPLFFVFLYFLYIICVKSIIKLLYYLLDT